MDQVHSSGFKKALKVLIFATICVASFLFHIWVRTQVTTQGFEIGKLQKSLLKVESETANALVENNQLHAPQNLELWANQLRESGYELRKAETSQVVYLSPGESQSRKKNRD